MEYKSNHNVVYSCKYHVVWCPKYRRKVLVNGVDLRLKKLIEEICSEYHIDIIEMKIMPDHVHMLIDASPKHSISSMMKGYKGVSARMLFMHHPEIKEKLCGGHLWQPSYFAGTVSERSEDMIREYIRKQK